MPVTSNNQARGRCIDKITFGFLIGATVGASVGALYGGFYGLRFGLRGRELFTNLGKAILQSGGTFGVFMGVGSGLRC